MMHQAQLHVGFLNQFSTSGSASATVHQSEVVFWLSFTKHTGPGEVGEVR